eukprot:CAMPEP_0205907432 /NCGR_PEP_ID=MMETSP1325-20131115/2544_1 /ASSEMBLY_ACC=CAM_ASM_000708 /TAXON_ID=236786 /ORGANISM="Florenciella sp., Strain RCC1007" /LENGTH=321 /DNA_ID=CAMNT_0053273525 /DNA_START=86 /DNA_END=1051 /DNA_ORIENTATION=+
MLVLCRSALGGALGTSSCGAVVRSSRVAMVATPSQRGHSTTSNPPAPSSTTERHETLHRALPPVATPFARQPTLEDRRSIEERQLRHPASDLAAVPAQCQCPYGFPQAILLRPVGKNKPVSGLIRLTCPHLVAAVDEFEAEGGVASMNRELVGGARGPEWQEALQGINDAHRQLRRALTSEAEAERVKERFGEAGAESFFNSGIAGMSPTKLDDVKCLHAQLADSLLRGRDNNKIGSAVEEELRARGVDIGGNGCCYEQCDYNRAETKDTWSYVPIKNKQKLRTRNARRSQEKEKERAARRRRGPEAASSAAKQDPGEGEV